MACCRSLERICSDGGIWSGLVRSLVLHGHRPPNPYPLRGIDSEQMSLAMNSVLSLPSTSWRSVFTQFLRYDERSFASTDFSSIALADAETLARTGAGSATCSALLLETLLVGASDSEVAHFFYNCKFGPHWRGIRYLNTFGELLSLKFSQPPLRLKISVKMFQHKGR